MEKEEHSADNFGVKHRFTFRILGFSYFVFLAFCSFHTLHLFIFRI